MAYINQYEYLEKYFWKFLDALNVDKAGNGGIIVSHGDKVSQYQVKWENAGLRYEQGAAIYLLSYLAPYSNEVRKSKSGKWVDPSDWVIANKALFTPFLDGLEAEEG